MSDKRSTLQKLKERDWPAIKQDVDTAINEQVFDPLMRSGHTKAAIAAGTAAGTAADFIIPQDDTDAALAVLGAGGVGKVVGSARKSSRLQKMLANTPEVNKLTGKQKKELIQWNESTNKNLKGDLLDSDPIGKPALSSLQEGADQAVAQKSTLALRDKLGQKYLSELQKRHPDKYKEAVVSTMRVKNISAKEAIDKVNNDTISSPGYFNEYISAVRAGKI